LIRLSKGVAPPSAPEHALKCRLSWHASTGIQAVFYFLYGNNLIALAFMLSSLFSNSRTAVTVAFLYVFASGLIGNLLLEVNVRAGRGGTDGAADNLCSWS
jgi:hypothetical protein